MEQKFVCRQCKEEKQEEPRTLLKEDKSGFMLLFTPLCEKCLNELKSHSIKELFTLKED